MSVDPEGIYPVRLSVATLEKAPDEIDPAARGELFVEWPRPPRVGTKIRLELSFGEEAPVPLPAMVTWSRPPRVGTMAGFRARLEDPPPLVMDTIGRMVDKARDRVLLKQIQSGAARKAPVQREAVVERNSARAVDGRGDVAQARGPIPPPPPAPPRRALPDEPVAAPPPPSNRRAPPSVSLPPLSGPQDDDLPEFEPGSGRSAHHEFVRGTAHERSDAIELDSAYDSLPLELETYGSRAAPPPPAKAARSAPATERPRPLQPSSADMSFAPSEGPLEMATIPPPPIRRRGSEFIGVDGDEEESLDLGFVPPSVLPPRPAPPPKPVPAPPPLRPPPAALPVSAPRPAGPRGASGPLTDDDAFDMAFDMGPPAAPVQKPAGATPAPRPAPPAVPAAKPSAPPPARRPPMDPDEAAFDLAFDLGGPPAASPPPVTPRPVGPAAAPLPAPAPAPAPRGPAPRGLDVSIFDDVESVPPGGTPALGVGPPPLGVGTLPPEPLPIRIGFANLRSFQMHYRLFLSQQRVYCTVAPFPTPGEPVALVVDLPDGIAAHAGLAIVEAHVAPPQVPAAGWVAVLLDPDGSLEGRIRNAAQLNGID